MPHPLHLLALSAILLAVSVPAHALRCGGRIVSDGDRDFQVSARCGEPFWTDSYQGVDVLRQGLHAQRLREVRWDIWYYNFGPRALMHRLIFVDGVLNRSETLGYGFNTIGANCNPNAGFTGLSAGEVVARCGEPGSRRRFDDTVVQRPQRHVEHWRDERREEWIYDVGANQYLRSLKLLNGRVTAVEYLPR